MTTSPTAQSVGLSAQQVDLVLRGLRFVRSSISMGMHDPSDSVAEQRSQQLREVDGLVRQLRGGELVSGRA